MQVVFVHGVNTRDIGDGDYQRWVDGRSDRLRRLAFGGKAEIRNPYWGEFGLSVKTLLALPSAKGKVAPLGLETKTAAAVHNEAVVVSRRDFQSAIASLSAAAIADATLNGSVSERHAVEDFWMAASAYADNDPDPDWLADIRTDEELLTHLRQIVSPEQEGRAHTVLERSGWKEFIPSFDGSAFAAERARELMAGYLAQFIGDALMFFSRRDKSIAVRRAISGDIVAAARAAKDKAQPLVLIGYSMGGGILHELLTDPTEVAQIEEELGFGLTVDLFLSVGTQIGLFAELNQFVKPSGGKLLSVPITHYWNVFDYNDTLAFLCEPLLPGVVDMEVSTAAGVIGAHGAYFDSALFFRRLRKRLIDAGLA
jgi:hypothetical protein